MSTTIDGATRRLDEESVVTREHDAPRELVVEAWTDCDRLGTHLEEVKARAAHP